MRYTGPICFATFTSDLTKDQALGYGSTMLAVLYLDAHAASKVADALAHAGF